MMNSTIEAKEAAKINFEKVSDLMDQASSSIFISTSTTGLMKDNCQRRSPNKTFTACKAALEKFQRGKVDFTPFSAMDQIAAAYKNYPASVGSCKKSMILRVDLMDVASNKVCE